MVRAITVTAPNLAGPGAGVVDGEDEVGVAAAGEGDFDGEAAAVVVVAEGGLVDVDG